MTVIRKVPTRFVPTVNVEVALPPEDKLTLEGLRLALLLVEARPTSPLKLLRLVMVRVVEFENPNSTTIDWGSAEITKSDCVWEKTAIETEWDSAA